MKFIKQTNLLRVILRAGRLLRRCCLLRHSGLLRGGGRSLLGGCSGLLGSGGLGDDGLLRGSSLGRSGLLGGSGGSLLRRRLLGLGRLLGARRLSVLLGVAGGGGSVLGRQLYLARRALGKNKDALVGALGDGAVELRDTGASEVDVVLVLGVLYHESAPATLGNHKADQTNLLDSVTRYTSAVLSLDDALLYDS